MAGPSVIRHNLELNMFPASATKDFFDSTTTTAEHHGKFVVRKLSSLVQDSNITNLLRSKFVGPFRSFGNTVNIPSFTHFVCHIVGISANRKMGGIAARRVIARVHDAITIWDLAFSKLISQSMRFVIDSRITELTIPIFVLMLPPNPTSFRATGFVNESPEFILNGNLLWEFMAVLVVAKHATTLTFLAVLLKFFLTVGANGGTIEAHGNLSFPCHSLGCYEQREGFLWLKSNSIIPELRLNY